MLERFTDQARRVIVLAQDEARMLNHDRVGTEHLLLGLIHEDQGVAAEALESLGISLEAVRREVEEITGRGQRAPSGHIPFTTSAKAALERSLREALQLGHDSIGAEHILLALTREDAEAAAQVLTRLGADLDRVRQQVIRLVRSAGPEQARPSAPPARTTAGGVQARLDAIERRLAALERRVGTGCARRARRRRRGRPGHGFCPCRPARPGTRSPWRRSIPGRSGSPGWRRGSSRPSGPVPRGS